MPGLSLYNTPQTTGQRIRSGLEDRLVEGVTNAQPLRKLAAMGMAGNVDPERMEQYRQLAMLLGVNGIPQAGSPTQGIPQMPNPQV